MASAARALRHCHDHGCPPSPSPFGLPACRVIFEPSGQHVHQQWAMSLAGDLPRNYRLSVVKMLMPFPPREMVTYHCCCLVAAFVHESEKPLKSWKVCKWATVSSCPTCRSGTTRSGSNSIESPVSHQQSTPARPIPPPAAFPPRFSPFAPSPLKNPPSPAPG